MHLLQVPLCARDGEADGRQCQRCWGDDFTYTADHQRTRPMATLGVPKGMLGLTRSHCYNIVYLPTSPPESSD